ncbi:MAG: helix-turn-helix transcriptional regulator [Archaeoglobales archaeon]|jgi:predicted transcriptional regulator|nr:helix-turn-helix domain-containing protein [Archaeoglobus sp.]NHW89312.1 helix-turn-helix transcriptional regulator [Archaeoglobales archaeon]
MSERVRDKEHHEKLFKASMSPIRRDIVAAIGTQGKTLEELKKELNLTEFQLKFNLDWLIREGFVKEEGGKLKLTEDGLDLLRA